MPLSGWEHAHLGGDGDITYISNGTSEHFITAGDDGLVRLHNASTMEATEDEMINEHSDQTVRALAASRDGAFFATGSEDSHVKLFAYPSLECKGTVSRFALPVRPSRCSDHFFCSFGEFAHFIQRQRAGIRCSAGTEHGHESRMCRCKRSRSARTAQSSLLEDRMTPSGDAQQPPRAPQPIQADATGAISQAREHHGRRLPDQALLQESQHAPRHEPLLRPQGSAPAGSPPANTPRAPRRKLSPLAGSHRVCPCLRPSQGVFLASCHDDGTVLIWNVEEGALAKDLGKARQEFAEHALAADGTPLL